MGAGTLDDAAGTTDVLGASLEETVDLAPGDAFWGGPLGSIGREDLVTALTDEVTLASRSARRSGTGCSSRPARTVVAELSSRPARAVPRSRASFALSARISNPKSPCAVFGTKKTLNLERQVDLEPTPRAKNLTR